MLLKGNVKSPSVFCLGYKDQLGEWVWDKAQEQGIGPGEGQRFSPECIYHPSLGWRRNFRLDLNKKLVQEADKPADTLTFVWCLSDKTGDLRNLKHTARFSLQNDICPDLELERMGKLEVSGNLWGQTWTSHNYSIPRSPITLSVGSPAFGVGLSQTWMAPPECSYFTNPVQSRFDWDQCFPICLTEERSLALFRLKSLLFFYLLSSIQWKSTRPMKMEEARNEVDISRR